MTGSDLFLAIDIGGTFTDIVAFDPTNATARFAKTPTRYDDLVAGIREAIARTGCDLSRCGILRHGTTLVINALLQRRGARTAMVTTQGFRDVLEIARGNRPRPFDLDYRRDPPLIARDMRFEVAERMTARGEPSVSLDEAGLEALADALAEHDVESVAIGFVNAYANDVHERRAAAILNQRMPGVYVTTSAALSEEWSEYERFATVAANAFVGPTMSGYIDRISGSLMEEGFGGQLYLMGSNGGLISAPRAAETPVALIESGPVGGCIGSAALAESLGVDEAVAFDMGGTTAKCAVVRDGGFAVESEYFVGGYDRGFPVRTSVVDIVEVGAGGGSIADADPLGRVSVGPRSAGSTPGPACFGRGGTEPTVTDAALVLGLLSEDAFLGGDMALDRAAAEAAVRRLAATLGRTGDDAVKETAGGITLLACTTMANAIRRVTIERGLDPRDYTLIAYGGAGPLHAVMLARILQMPRVIVPPEPGTFSANGMLLSDLRQDLTRTLALPLDEAALATARRAVDEMADEARVFLASETLANGPISRHAELGLRYTGQRNLIRLEILADDESVDGTADRFAKSYAARFGQSLPGRAIELHSVHLRSARPLPSPDLRAVAPAQGGGPVPVRTRPIRLPDGRGVTATVYDRYALPPEFAAKGPAIIEEYGSTTLIGPGDRFRVGEAGHLDIDCTGADR